MINIDEFMYEDGYSKGCEDTLRNVAIMISDNCGRNVCPFWRDCDVYSDEECIKRIIECFKSEI